MAASDSSKGQSPLTSPPFHDISTHNLRRSPLTCLQVEMVVYIFSSLQYLNQKLRWLFLTRLQSEVVVSNLSSSSYCLNYNLRLLRLTHIQAEVVASDSFMRRWLPYMEVFSKLIFLLQRGTSWGMEYQSLEIQRETQYQDATLMDTTLLHYKLM